MHKDKILSTLRLTSLFVYSTNRLFEYRRARAGVLAVTITTANRCFLCRLQKKIQQLFISIHAPVQRFLGSHSSTSATINFVQGPNMLCSSEEGMMISTGNFAYKYGCVSDRGGTRYDNVDKLLIISFMIDDELFHCKAHE